MQDGIISNGLECGTRGGLLCYFSVQTSADPHPGTTALQGK